MRATRRRYRGDSLVLETEFDTDDGTVRVVDCMPVRDQYPEKGLRDRCWVTPAEAVTRIEERGLRAVVRGALASRAG